MKILITACRMLIIPLFVIFIAGCSSGGSMLDNMVSEGGSEAGGEDSGEETPTVIPDDGYLKSIHVSPGDGSGYVLLDKNIIDSQFPPIDVVLHYNLLNAGWTPSIAVFDVADGDTSTVYGLLMELDAATKKAMGFGLFTDFKGLVLRATLEDIPAFIAQMEGGGNPFEGDVPDFIENLALVIEEMPAGSLPKFATFINYLISQIGGESGINGLTVPVGGDGDCYELTVQNIGTGIGICEVAPFWLIGYRGMLDTLKANAQGYNNGIRNTNFSGDPLFLNQVKSMYKPGTDSDPFLMAAVDLSTIVPDGEGQTILALVNELIGDYLLPLDFLRAGAAISVDNPAYVKVVAQGWNPNVDSSYDAKVEVRIALSTLVAQNFKADNFFALEGPNELITGIADTLKQVIEVFNQYCEETGCQ